jgi:hypothetical protein
MYLIDKFNNKETFPNSPPKIILISMLHKFILMPTGQGRPKGAPNKRKRAVVVSSSDAEEWVASDSSVEV